MTTSEPPAPRQPPGDPPPAGQRPGRPAADEAGDGVPVLLLHAFPLSRRMWQPQLAGLADCCRLLAPDLPGFGSSAPPGAAAGPAGAIPAAPASPAGGSGRPGGAGRSASAGSAERPIGPARKRGGAPSPAAAVCRMEDMAAAAVELLDSRGVETAVVCGLSMGGYVALALCELFAGRVRALVLADTRAGADDDAARRRRLESALEVESRGSAALVGSVSKLLGADTRSRRPDLVAWLRREIAAAPPAGVGAALRGMAERPDRTPLLPSLAVPALVVVGAQDELTPPPESELLRDRIPGARLVTLAGAGHLSNLEQPEAFNAALRGFLKEI
jgi:3-oxoadipate enol-lactonase